LPIRHRKILLLTQMFMIIFLITPEDENPVKI